MIGPIVKTGDSPAIPAAAALVAGIWLGSWSVEGGREALLLAGVCAVLLIIVRAAERDPKRWLGFLLFWTAIGFASGQLRVAEPADTARRAAALLPADAERVDRIEGVLVDFWSDAPPRARSRLRAERLWRAGAWQPFPAEISLFIAGQTPIEPVADRGDRIAVVGRLRARELSASPRDITLPWPSYRLSVKSALLVERKERTPLALLHAPNRKLYGSLPAEGGKFDRDVAGPLSALLLGRTADLDRGMVASYRRGGLYHLLVVSGMHVVLAGVLVVGGLRWLKVRGKKRDALLLVSILLFVLVAGANPPALRAGIVFAVYLAARLFERPVTGWQAIGLSALLLFLVAPEQIFSIGTVLTFAAVCGIALFTDPIRSWLPQKPVWLFSGFAAALAAEIATAPILFWRFNLVAAAAWLTAPLSIPLSTGLIALGGLLLAAFAAGLNPAPLVALFAWGSRALEFVAERAAGVAFLRTTPPLGTIVLIVILVLAGGLCRRRWRAATLAGAAALFLFLALRPGPSGPRQGFSLEALDIGQGDALLLRWERHAVLVDGGGPFDLDARDFGRTRLLPKLLDRGVTRLDAVVLTHPHPDHALGLFAVLEELPVRTLWRSTGQDEGGLYRQLEEVARKRKTSVRALATGEAVVWPDARMAVLHSGGRRRKIDATNNQSLVFLFERSGRRALLTGDSGAPTEIALVGDGRIPVIDVLKVGHHGSRGSTTPEFVRAASPRAAIVSCGRENRFGHPAPETLETLRSLGVPLFRTDRLSDVRLEMAPRSIRISWRGLP